MFDCGVPLDGIMVFGNGIFCNDILFNESAFGCNSVVICCNANELFGFAALWVLGVICEVSIDVFLGAASVWVLNLLGVICEVCIDVFLGAASVWLFDVLFRCNNIAGIGICTFSGVLNFLTLGCSKFTDSGSGFMGNIGGFNPVRDFFKSTGGDLVSFVLNDLFVVNISSSGGGGGGDSCSKLDDSNSSDGGGSELMFSGDPCFDEGAPNECVGNCTLGDPCFDEGKLCGVNKCALGDPCFDEGKLCGGDNCALGEGKLCGVNNCALGEGNLCSGDNCALDEGKLCGDNCTLGEGNLCSGDNCTLGEGKLCGGDNCTLDEGKLCGGDNCALDEGKLCGDNCTLGDPCFDGCRTDCLSEIKRFFISFNISRVFCNSVLLFICLYCNKSSNN